MGNFGKFIKTTKWNFLVIDHLVSPSCKVREVRRMISEGVDVNGVDDEFASTGLMMAMSNGNNDVVRILLDCNNIKIDVRDKFGSTALHYACINNQVENVKLFLEHASCNKEIVMIVDSRGYTAEMMAEKRGNKESARIIREYLENSDDREIPGTVDEDARSVDDVVEFMIGGTKKKKKRRKKKNIVQSVSVEAGKTGTMDDSGKGVHDTIKKDGFRKQQPILLDKRVPESVERSDYAEYKNLTKNKEELEKKIVEKQKEFHTHKEKVKNLIDTKSAETKNLESMIEKTQVEKNRKLNEVVKMDHELLDLGRKMAESKLQKTKLLEESKIYDERLNKYGSKKLELECDIKKELEINKEKANTIKDEILDCETRLKETEKLLKNHPGKGELFHEPNKELLEFIDHQIVEKENELECPVCLEVAYSPIFMCSEQHLICSTCRLKLSNCPECREVYSGKNRRHRYAEKTAEELQRLKNKKDHFRKYSRQKIF